MKIRLVTVVWGRQFADLFLRVGLRTLLAEGNAAALARAHQVIYSIYTTAEDAELLEAAPAFACLRRDVDVRMSLFTPGEIDVGNYGSHGIFWNRVVELARRNAEVVFFIIPDVLYAEGTLLRWAARFEAGAGAIFTIGPQVALESVLPEIEQRWPDRGSACPLPREQLFDLLYRHFHPLHAAMRHDSPRRPSHPEYDLRLVPQRGFVIREIVSHPFCLDPRRYANLRHYGPQDHLESIALEPCCTLSVEPLLKRLRLYYRPWPLDESRLSNLAGWWDCFTTAACEYETAFPFEISRNQDALWRAGRSRAAAGGRFYRSQILAAGRLYQLFVALRARQAYKAANLLALAIYAGRLRRRLCLREGATLLLPSERALAADAGRINALLAPGRERELVDLIADHVVLRGEDAGESRRLRRRAAFAGHAIAADALFTARGLPADSLVRHASRTETPFAVGPFTVITIDRVLWRGGGAAMGPGAGTPLAPEVASAGSTATASSPPGYSRIFVVTKWARRSPLHRVIYLALHVPFLEPFVALLFPVYFSRTARDVLYRVPVARRLRANWRAGHFRPDRLRSSLVRAVATVPLLGLLLRRTKGRITRSGTIDRTLAFPRRVVRVVRRDGVTIAWSKARSLASDAVAAKINVRTFGFDDEQREILNEVRSARALQAVADVLGDLENKMGGGEFRSEPLARLRDLLRERGIDSALVERYLVRLTRRYPSWCEAWLELGFLYQDQDRSSDALACFGRAMNASRMTDVAGRDPHPVAIAAANPGWLLARAGRHSEAAECFARALHSDPSQKMIAVELAHLLRRQGKMDQALIYYGDGMYHQESHWSLPTEPRNFYDLQFRRLTGAPKEPPAQRLAPAVVNDAEGAPLQRSRLTG